MVTGLAAKHRINLKWPYSSVADIKFMQIVTSRCPLVLEDNVLDYPYI